MILSEEIRQAATLYAVQQWDPSEKPKEFDNAYENFTMGGEMILKRVIEILEEQKQKFQELNYSIFPEAYGRIIESLKQK